MTTRYLNAHSISLSKPQSYEGKPEPAYNLYPIYENEGNFSQLVNVIVHSSPIKSEKEIKDEKETKPNHFENIQKTLNKIQLPSYEINFLGSRLSLIKLIATWLLDFFVMIPFFILKNFYEGCLTTYTLLKHKEWKKASIYCSLYFMDTALPLSYIFLFFILILDSNQYFSSWAMSCFIQFCVFLLLSIYYSLLTDKNFDWRNLTHLDIMGLGLSRKYYEERMEIDPKMKNLLRTRYSIAKKIFKNKNFKDFQKNLQVIFNTLTIDDTFFYYSFFDEDFQPNKNFDYETNALLASQLIYASHKGEDLLFNINKSNLDSEEEEQQVKPWHVLFFAFLIFCKIVAPYIYCFEDLSSETINYFALFSITLFYIYIMAVVYPLLSHEDLKRRTYILDQLDYLIKFQQDISIDDDVFHEYKGNSPSKKTDSYAAEQLKISGVREITSKWQLKLDVTCIISFETWDNCRRAALVMDTKRSEKYEIIYIFLGVYFFFVILVLLQVLFDVYVFFSQSSALNTPLMVFVFTVDCFIMLILFFQRIFYGSEFNETFKKHLNSLETLTRIYEDLIDLFNVYEDENYPINNEIYRAILKRIIKKYESNRPKKLFQSQDRNYSDKYEILIFLQKILDSTKRIKEQIIYDQTHYEHRFLGILTSDFQTIMAQVAIVLIPILPTLIGAISGNN